MHVGAGLLVLLLLVSAAGCGASGSDPASSGQASSGAGGTGASGAGGASGASPTGGAGGMAVAGAGGGAAAGSPGGNVTFAITGKLETVDAVGTESFGIALTPTTAPASSVTLTHSRLFFVHEGGFAYFFSDAVKTTGTLYGVGPGLGAGASYPIKLHYGWSTPLAHAVFAMAGTDAGVAFERVVQAQLLREGFTDPAPLALDGPASIGVRGPLVRVKTLGGETRVPIVAQVVPWTARDVATTKLTATIAGQVTDFSKPATLLGVPTQVAVPASAADASVTFDAAFTVDGAPASATRTVPVVDVTPVLVTSPVKGTWTWRNGPCETSLHTHHRYPEQRWAYDLLVVQGIVTFKGDPKLNTSYFAFDQPFFAALPGKVLLADDTQEDNDGSSMTAKNPDGANNQIVVEQGDGVRCIYAHLRKGTAKKKVGDVVQVGDELGRVGNAGQSSEPHLHFSCYRIDATGRASALPLALSVGPDTGTPSGGEALTTP